MAAILRLLTVLHGGPTPYDGQYVVHYDPVCPSTAPDGTALPFTLETTPDLAQARRFDTGGEAWEYYRRDTGWAREDGRPDRPLTAWAVEVGHLGADPCPN